MDLETENRIAAILLKEAAELRRQAQREGALAYLRQPTVRCRPNSRFLTATVRGVQQANRAVEVNEMWRLREKQLELDQRLSNGRRTHNGVSDSRSSKSTGCKEVERNASPSCSSKKRSKDHPYPMEDEGLKDDEVDEFLQSRTKRGRGAVGSRMEETGPYLPICPDYERCALETAGIELRKARVLLGPKKPDSLKFEESSDDECKKKKARKGLCKRHSGVYKSKDKSIDKKKRRKEKKHKHHHK